MTWREAVMRDTFEKSLAVQFGQVMAERDSELRAAIPDPKRREQHMWAEHARGAEVAYGVFRAAFHGLSDKALLECNTAVHELLKSLGEDAWKQCRGAEAAPSVLARAATFGAPGFCERSFDADVARASIPKQKDADLDRG